MKRLIDRDKLWEMFVGHYWDSLKSDRDIILCHVDAVMRMVADEPPPPDLAALYTLTDANLKVVEENKRLTDVAADMVESLEQCAADLEASVNAEYAGTLDYPSQARKHERDLEPVRKARAAIAKAMHG